MIDTDMAEQILQGDDTHPDILQALGLEMLAEVKRLNKVVTMLKKNDLWVSTEGWEESDKDDELLVSMNYLICTALGR